MAIRHAALNCPRFAIMQRVTFATSGMKSEQSRMASGVQAWRASGVPCWAAASPMPMAAIAISRSPAGNKVLQAKYKVRSMLLFPLGVPCGSSARAPTLKHDPKTENQFSEKFHARLKIARYATCREERARQGGMGHQCEPQAKPLDARGTSRGRASRHRSTVFSINS